MAISPVCFFVVRPARDRIPSRPSSDSHSQLVLSNWVYRDNSSHDRNTVLSFKRLRMVWTGLKKGSDGFKPGNSSCRQRIVFRMLQGSLSLTPHLSSVRKHMFSENLGVVPHNRHFYPIEKADKPNRRRRVE